NIKAAPAKVDVDDDEEERRSAPVRIPPTEPPPTRRSLTTYIVLGIVAAAVVAGGIVVLNVISNKAKNKSVAASSSGARRTSDDDSSSNPSTSSSTAVGLRPHPGGIAWLSQAIANMADDDVRSLKSEINKPWASATALPGTPTVIAVSRKFAEVNSQQQNTLAGAVALVKGDSRIIDILDNGPLYEPALEFNDEAHVSIRGATGYRPLLVWDLKGSVAAFIKMRQGSLFLENLDIVIRLSDKAPEAAFVALADCDLDVKGCSFSDVGASKNGFAAVRFETTTNHRCRFSNCVVRGSHLSALDVEGPAADVLFENCLLAGNERPLIRVAAPVQAGITLRLVRSVAVAGDNLLEVRGQSANDSPALQFIGWDSVLARCHTQPGGAMVRVDDIKPSNGVEWRAVNCIYAGWKNLLEAKENIAAEDWATWVQRFQNADNDKADRESWPPAFGGELGMRPAGDFQVRPDMPVAYFRTREPKKSSKDQPSSNAPLGCDVAALPVLRDGWYNLVYDRGSIERDRLVPDHFDGSSLDKAPNGPANPYAG
ncbi:MAG TPA: hypothetical protein VGX76_05315, partial [Pirellulales bacterium]|nr:hypothetical protein [Pirellulales bacterium]